MGMYDRAVKSATRMLTKYGRAVVLRKFSDAPVYDSNTGTTSDGPIDSELMGAFFDYSEGQMLDSGLVQGGDKKLYLQANGIVKPELQDQIVVTENDVEVLYSILSIKEVNPAGVSVLFELHIRT